ncbi:MAG: hypothetical protein P0Y62_18965 [Candidatus Chryseobacterium colombiense]|nr:hypothetical protein [Chryseobacterium sp.]WEK69875.1 MAG: hypothetical protein P0Y62_18965 [Chryseobacterium sp.]
MSTNKTFVVKHASDMTNVELFEELKMRGFFTFPFNLNNIRKPEQLKNMVVGVSEPDEDIFYRLHHDFYTKNKEDILNGKYDDPK